MRRAAASCRPARRSKHDAIRSSVDTTTRGDIGAVTTAGRLVRFSPVDLPRSPATRCSSAAGDAAPTSTSGSATGEHVVALVPLADDAADRPRHRAGRGQARRARAEIADKHDIEIIALQGRRPRSSGAAPASDGAELVFVASDAQLLRFDASSVRPAGPFRRRHGGHPAHATVRASSPSASSAPRSSTPSWSRSPARRRRSPGTDAGSAKVSRLQRVPAKGRATGGVRAQRFLRGEDALTLAWVGTDPRAVGADGAVRALPDRARSAMPRARRSTASSARSAPASARRRSRRRASDDASPAAAPSSLVDDAQASMRSRASRSLESMMNSLRGATSLPMSSSKTRCRQPRHPRSRTRRSGAAGAVHRRRRELVGIHLAEALVALHRLLPALAGLAELVEQAVELLLGVGVDRLVRLGAGVHDDHAVQRRHGRVDAALLDERAHVAEEERQQQGADVRAVDVGVAHQDDLAVARRARGRRSDPSPRRSPG